MTEAVTRHNKVMPDEAVPEIDIGIDQLLSDIRQATEELDMNRGPSVEVAQSSTLFDAVANAHEVAMRLSGEIQEARNAFLGPRETKTSTEPRRLGGEGVLNNSLNLLHDATVALYEARSMLSEITEKVGGHNI